MSWRPRMPSRPSKRAIANHLEFLAGGTDMKAPVQRGPQAEGDTNKVIATWRHLHPRLYLERNKRRLATPVGYHQPIMLGWLADGSPDWLGWESVEITPSMVGKRVAVFVGIEAKRASGGTLQDNQERFLNTLKDAGGISGVARDAEDAERILSLWRERLL